MKDIADIVSEIFSSQVKKPTFEIFQYVLVVLPSSFFNPGLGPAVAELHKTTIGN